MPVGATGGFKQRRSWTLRAGERSLADETRQVAEQGKRVADDRRFVGVGQAEEGGAFEIVAGLGGVARFGIALATQAQLPGVGADGQVTRQADLAAVGSIFGECKAD